VKAVADEHGPAHIFEGTNADNIRDMDAKGRRGRRPNANKSHCLHGHAFTEANTRIRIKASGGQQRDCRQCVRERGWKQPV
jgi:hypothetical protein